MAMRVRLFVFDDDGSLRRLPKELADELVTGRTRLQEYAGRTLRIAEVILKTEGRKPVRVVSVKGLFWHFDERGELRSLTRPVAEDFRTKRALQEEAAGNAGPVVSISARMARKRWEAQNQWEPTPSDITRVVNSIWPKAAGRAVEAMRSIETSWKRRTPVSYEAKVCLSKCRTHVLAISQQLEELDDRSLKSVVEKSRENAADTDVLRPALWEGIAHAAERELQRRKA